MYLEYTKVARALEQVRDENASVDTSQHQIRLGLERRWDVEDIKRIDWKDIDISKTSDGFEVSDLRHSVGLALCRLILPVGALSLEYAIPLDPKIGDDPRGELVFNSETGRFGSSPILAVEITDG